MIGVDLGDKRVGIALCIEGIVLPHLIVARVELVKILKKIIQERDTHYIVVGLPYDLYGKDIKQLEKTQKFIEKLHAIFPDQKIRGFDERFTSIEADSTIEKFGNKTKTEYKDDISAALILEGYIQTQKHII